MQVTLLILLATGLVALAKKIPDFISHVAARSHNAVLKQVLAWGSGLVIAFLMSAQSAVNALTAHGGVSVQGWNGITKALLGIGLGSLASVLHDALSAVDNNGSTAVPAILPRPAVTPPPAP